MTRRLAWFFFASCFSSYMIFLLAGSFIEAEAIDLSRIVNMRDALQPGVHHLTGMVMVPRTCAELSVETRNISNTTYQLAFRTWDEPSVECTVDDTPRAFHAIVFAPAVGMTFTASLNDEPLTVIVTQEKIAP